MPASSLREYRAVRAETRLRRGRRLPIPLSVLALRPREDALDFGSTD
jgi:hypothetical protein